MQYVKREFERALSYGLLFSALALGLTAGSVAASDDGVKQNEILIGQLGPLTGENFAFGALVMQGNDVVFNEINANGGIHGRMIKTTKADTECRAEPAVGAARKLVDRQIFAIIGAGCSNATLANMPTIIEADIPTIVQGATHDGITTPVNCCFYRAVMKGSEEGAIQARFVKTIPNIDSVAIIAQHDAWGQAKYDGFMAEAERLGLNIVADEEMTPNSSNAGAQVQRLVAANPDVIVTLLFPRPTNLFLREAHRHGLTDLPIIGHTSVSDLPKLANDIGTPEALRNFYTISLTSLTPDMDEAADLEARFKAVYPNEEFNQYAMWGIGAAELLVQAIEAAGPDLSRDSFRVAMESGAGFETSTFPAPLVFTPEDRDGNKSGMFLRYVDGQVVRVGTEF